MASIDLATISIEELRRELGRPQKTLLSLNTERQGRRRAGGPRRRVPQGERRRSTGPSGDEARPASTADPPSVHGISLRDALSPAVETRVVVSPTEPAKLVLANGFLTKSKTFVAAVSNALSADARIQRVGRGRYAMMDA